MSDTLKSLLTNSTRTAGTVTHSESELFTIFTESGCSTKTDMIMVLHGLGISQSSIAVTLRKYGILSEKSSRQHVRNTIERKTGS